MKPAVTTRDAAAIRAEMAKVYTSLAAMHHPNDINQMCTKGYDANVTPGTFEGGKIKGQVLGC